MPSSLSTEILKDAYRYVPSHLVPGICGLASLSIFSRLLLPDEYAKYMLLLTTVTFIANIGFAWLNFSGLRFFDENRADAGTFMSTCAVAIILLLAAASVIGYASFRLMSFLDLLKLPDGIFLVGAALLASKVAFDQVLIFVRAERNAVRYSLFRVMDAVLKLALAIVFILFFRTGYLGIIYGMIGSFMVITLFELYRSPRYRKVRINRFSRNQFLAMLRYGVPLIAVGVLGTVLSLADRYMLAWLADYNQVGLYSAGYRLAEMAVDIPASILLMAYLPIVISEFNNPGSEIGRILSKPLQLTFVILLPATCGTILLSGDIAGLFLGTRYSESHSIFPWVCSGIFFSSLNQIYIRVFELKQVTRLILFSSVMAASANIVLNYFLIPGFGYLGAGIATSIAYLIQLSTSVLLSLPYARIPLPHYSILCSIAASFVMCTGITFLFRFFPWTGGGALTAKVISGVVIYSTMLCLMREPVFLSLLQNRSAYIR
jgi:O-antigen/teichoic acid export membrane protein